MMIAYLILAHANFSVCQELIDELLSDERSVVYLHIDAKGNAWAMNSLGEFYLTGTVVEKNISRAITLFKAAAQKGIGRRSIIWVCFIMKVNLLKKIIQLQLNTSKKQHGQGLKTLSNG